MMESMLKTTKIAKINPLYWICIMKAIFDQINRLLLFTLFPMLVEMYKNIKFTLKIHMNV